MKILLDTNTCIALMKGHEKAMRRLTGLRPSDCAVSTLTCYELFTGVHKCQNPARERQKVTRLLGMIRVLVFDEAAAEKAAEIRAHLESIGKVCGPYDMLLAGHAISRQLRMVTNNVSEFSRVPGLAVEDWLA
ncbi:MAG: type II toxin-antitoxin system VapC family toxin [Prosthecobacter sp.]|jgi:tRNA(fMet)-specific endonuclease VapC|uniref:type II toxin-antitoxin system VapC family toxin n=1 Tax=Prosthecobacter sp. TaxID=1965333 RepID=UPI001A0E1C60|nr:type II toxin-antitoxin system VapC family toxin [Prosthecobacter sp.]MBE2282121.1 type II toxin-antitoxin system VapC family toxin [Prosthecobacter sp.]